jgi:hypothetical protein
MILQRLREKSHGFTTRPQEISLLIKAKYLFLLLLLSRLRSESTGKVYASVEAVVA